MSNYAVYGSDPYRESGCVLVDRTAATGSLFVLSRWRGDESVENQEKTIEFQRFFIFFQTLFECKFWCFFKIRILGFARFSRNLSMTIEGGKREKRAEKISKVEKVGKSLGR